MRRHKGNKRHESYQGNKRQWLNYIANRLKTASQISTEIVKIPL